jgi:lysocardiolipin and lysophospholipid acyltransferase
MEGRGPRFLNMHWRRFELSSIPINDTAAFDAWLLARWREKDVLLEHYTRTGGFPIDAEAIVIEGSGVEHADANGSTNGTLHKETAEPVVASVSPNGPLEFLQIYVSMLTVPVLWTLVRWVYMVLRLVLLVASLGQVRI